MIVIVDVNVLLSALIRDSITRKIIVKSGLEFCFPEPSLHKIRKYKEYIIEKSGLSELEFLVILHNLLCFVRIIPTEEIIQNWDKAKQIMEHIDPEDVTFIATALSKENSIIWSDDKDFEKQNKIVVLKTRDMINLLSYQ